MKKYISYAITIFLFSFGIANAELHLVLNKGLRAAIPIAIVPFAGQRSNLASSYSIANVISNDLKNSGHFKTMPFASMKTKPTDIKQINFSAWQQSNYDYMLIGSVEPVGANSARVSFSLVNIIIGNNNPQKPQHAIVMSNAFTVNTAQLRATAHEISDMVYQQLTGIRGVFSTRIAYVLIKRAPGEFPQYFLEVADADGYDPRALVHSNEPLMSPAWSPNGKEIAYVSLANKKASIYIVDVATGKQRLVSDFPGINGAPAWSPNGKELAIVLSKTGHPKLYFYNLATGKLKQMTFGYSIDTEPNFSPNGKSIIFTSNRGGGPQIYQLNLSNKQISRLTFTGNYNARAFFTNNGKAIVLLHRNSQGFNIALQNLASGVLKLLTHNGYDSSPSVAPNGQMIIYGNDATIKGSLGLVSADGQVQLTLPAPEGTVLEPAWSPFLS